MLASAIHHRPNTVISYTRSPLLLYFFCARSLLLFCHSCTRSLLSPYLMPALAIYLVSTLAICLMLDPVVSHSRFPTLLSLHLLLILAFSYLRSPLFKTFKQVLSDETWLKSQQVLYSYFVTFQLLAYMIQLITTNISRFFIWSLLTFTHLPASLLKKKMT